MATANAARSLADDNDDVTKMSEGTSAGDISELTESERDFRLKMKTEYQPECDDEERRRLDELLTQCHDYIYSCQSQSHLMTSSKIITNGSLTSRTTSSPPNDVTPGVMAACWLELPVSSSYDAFPFPANDVVECSAVTSHVRCHDNVSTAETIKAAAATTTKTTIILFTTTTATTTTTTKLLIILL